jgi:hypothetical protein
MPAGEMRARRVRRKSLKILPSDVVVSHGAETSNQYFLYQYEECL